MVLPSLTQPGLLVFEGENVLRSWLAKLFLTFALTSRSTLKAKRVKKRKSTEMNCPKNTLSRWHWNQEENVKTEETLLYLPSLVICQPLTPPEAPRLQCGICDSLCLNNLCLRRWKHLHEQKTSSLGSILYQSLLHEKVLFFKHRCLVLEILIISLRKQYFRFFF